jgi:hypothetical protein
MINKESVKQYVLDNPKSVSMRESTALPGAYVLKYKKSVFYNNTWDDFLEHCRGTVVDKDFNLIAYPFQKIYNYGIEDRAPKFSEIDTLVTAFRKVNGFMVSVSYWNGDVLVSTTGSTDNDYVNYAKEMMLKHMCWEDWQLALNKSDMDGMTFMFECVHPKDPHIVPEKAGMYILGYRENTWQSKVGHDPFVLQDLGAIFNCFVPESLTTNMAQLQVLAKECKHEGYVAYTDDGVSFKIKSPYYLTNKWVARNPRTEKLLTKEFKEQIDEEYYGLLSHVRENIESFTLLTEQDRLQFIREYLSK